MSVPGGLIAGGGLPSPAVFNKKLNIVDTGTNIAAIPSGSLGDGMLASCTADGGGLSSGIVYQRLTGTWIPVSMTKHDHSADTNAAGGLYSDVLHNGSKEILELLCLFPTTNSFFESGGYVNGGNVIDLADPAVDPKAPFVQITTGPQINGDAQGIMLSIKSFAFNAKVTMFFSLGVSDGSHLVVRHGLSVDDSFDPPSTTGGQLGLEACDSAGTQKNYDFLSVTNGTRVPTTVSSSLAAVQQTDWRGYRLENHPEIPTSKLFIDNTLVSTKTTNIPGGTDSARDFRTSIKSNNTTEKWIRFGAVRVIGTAYYPW